MAISVDQIKNLRARTGAGIADCKKALEQTNGDIDRAIDEMRKTGMAKAAKKAGRIAADGMLVIKLSSDHKRALLLEVNSETDFAAKDETFQTFAREAANAAFENNIDDVSVIAALSLQGQTVDEARHALIAKIGENIQLRRAKLLCTEGVIGSYSHGGRMAALVALSTDEPVLANNIAMHIVASHPEGIYPEDVPAEMIEKETIIFRAQALESGKPADIVEKMLAGRIKKYVSETSLTEQAFVKNPDQTIGDLLKQAKTTVLGFVRFEVGEGIEKEKINFADEVRAQLAGKA